MNLINYETPLDQTFSPSLSAKKASLATYKAKHQYSGGLTLPGFFQTTGFPWQLIGFVVILFLEGAAIFWSHYEGSSIEIILGLALFDILLAISAHWKHKEIVLFRNQIIFQTGEQQQHTKRQLKKAILVRNFFYLLILSSAFLKFYFFFSIYLYFDATAFLILVFYLLGGILHILCTGYALFTIIFWLQISKEHNKYIASNGKAFFFEKDEPLIHEIQTSENISITTVKAEPQAIIEKNGKFYFQTFGVLTDRQLGNLISLQKNDVQRHIVAKEGVRLQYTIYGMQPNGVQNK